MRKSRAAGPSGKPTKPPLMNTTSGRNLRRIPMAPTKPFPTRQTSRTLRAWLPTSARFVRSPALGCLRNLPALMAAKEIPASRARRASRESACPTYRMSRVLSCWVKASTTASIGAMWPADPPPLTRIRIGSLFYGVLRNIKQNTGREHHYNQA